MKGILGKKLGMTQVFDPESGVVGRHGDRGRTVSGRPDARRTRPTATRPCSSRSTRSPSASSRRPSRPSGEGGRRRRTGTSSSSAVRASSQVGETVTVEAFAPGEKVKVAGISIGKGFQGTIKRHNFRRGPVSHGSHNVRKPGSIGASATPSRVFKGMKMAGRMGGKRVTQLGLVVHEIDAERNLLLVRAPFRARRAASSRSGRRATAAPKAPLLGGSDREGRLARRGESSAPR